MYEIELNDGTDSMTITSPGVPLIERDIEGATDVTTLDLNVYTDFFAKKRLWSNAISEMSETEFNQLKGFYDRQFTAFQFPTLTITALGVTDVVVRMMLSPREVADNCGLVRNVTMDFRETVQMTQGLA